MSAPWLITLLHRRHDRGAFSCGDAALDQYLRNYARQNQDKDVGRTWVACRAGESRVVGYYTLSASSVEFMTLREEDRRQLPRYPVPVVHLGRLAVDATARGQRLGESLLVHGLENAERASQIVAVQAVEVRAKHETARRFYAHYGFTSLLDDLNHMYLSMKAVRRMMA